MGRIGETCEGPETDGLVGLDIEVHDGSLPHCMVWRSTRKWGRMARTPSITEKIDSGSWSLTMWS